MRNLLHGVARQIRRQSGHVVLAGLMLGSVLLQSGDAPMPREAKLVGRADVEAAIRRGVDYLLQSQNRDGSWGSAHRTKDLNISAPVPGAHHAFRAGTTALAVAGLLESGLDTQDSRVHEALHRGEQWLLDKLPQLRRADGVYLYNVWGHAYGLETLARMHRRETKDPARRRQIEEAMRGQIELLRHYESVDGGWGYYDFKAAAKRPTTDSTSFVTAAALVAFKAAQQEGVAPPADVLKRAIASIQRQGKPDQTYAYDDALRWRPMRTINRAAGSLGRSQACNVALRLWGDPKITDRVLTDWLQRLLDRNGWLSIGRKRPVPHESWFQVAGYFYYFGHYYAALSADQLPPETARPFQSRLAATLLALQEKDGSWWDYPLYDYHQAYGTGFALLTLAHCRPGLEPAR